MTGLLDEAPVCSRQNEGGLFLVIRGPDRGGRVRIDRDPITFGSSSKCTLVLTDSTVSRRHVEVAVVDGEFMVTDCDSTNGISIGGRRFERAPIGFGDEIKLGRTVVKLVPDEEFVEPEPASSHVFGSLVGGDTRMRQMFALLEDRAEITDLMDHHDGNLSAAARQAGIDRKHLRELVRKYAGLQGITDD